MRKIAYINSLILIFIIPWEDALVIPGLGTAGRVVGLAAAGFWVVTVAYEGRFRRLTPFHLFVLLFVLWNILSVFWTVNIVSTQSRLITYIQLLGLILMIWDIYKSQNWINWGLQIYVFGGFVAIGDTVNNYLNGIEFSPGRYSVKGANPDEVGMVLAIGLPIAWYLTLNTLNGNINGSPLKRYLWIINGIYIPAALFGISLTATRSAFIASFPTAFYILVSINRLRLSTRLVVFTFVGILLYFSGPLIPEASIERLSGTADALAEGDLSGRTVIWGDGLESFATNPIFGVGTSTFRTVNRVGKVAHNSFLSVLVEVGLIGFLLFGFAIFLAVDQIFRLPPYKLLFWLILFGSWILGAMVLTWEHKKITWLILSFIIASGKVNDSSAIQLAPTFIKQRLLNVNGSPSTINYKEASNL